MALKNPKTPDLAGTPHSPGIEKKAGGGGARSPYSRKGRKLCNAKGRMLLLHEFLRYLRQNGRQLKERENRIMSQTPPHRASRRTRFQSTWGTQITSFFWVPYYDSSSSKFWFLCFKIPFQSVAERVQALIPSTVTQPFLRLPTPHSPGTR